jgi:hypothetical protein
MWRLKAQSHRCILGVHEVECQCGLMCDIGDEHQVVSGRRPRVGFYGSSLQDWEGVPWCSLQVVPAVMSGLARVTDTPVSMVTRLLPLLPGLRRVDCHGRAFPTSWVRNEKLWVVGPSPSSPFLLVVSPVPVDFFWGYPCRQFLLRWPTPTHSQQMDLSVLLYSALGDHALLDALTL